jgi:hypothetical protein
VRQRSLFGRLQAAGLQIGYDKYAARRYQHNQLYRPDNARGICCADNSEFFRLARPASVGVDDAVAVHRQVSVVTRLKRDPVMMTQTPTIQVTHFKTTCCGAFPGGNADRSALLPWPGCRVSPAIHAKTYSRIRKLRCQRHRPATGFDLTVISPGIHQRGPGIGLLFLLRFADIAERFKRRGIPRDKSHLVGRRNGMQPAADRGGADIPQLHPPGPKNFVLESIEPLATELLDRGLGARVLETCLDVPEPLGFIDRAYDPAQ